MKQYAFLLIFALLAWGGNLCWAQSDSVKSSNSYTGIFDSLDVAEPDSGYYDYYDYEEYDQDLEAPEGLTKGQRNPIYYFGHDFSTIFTEGFLLSGFNELGGGLNMTYIPQVWGAYASYAATVEYKYGWGFGHHWLSAGVAYRLSSPWSTYDWHAYGGFVVGDGIGAEAGLQWSNNRYINHGKYGSYSISGGIRAMSSGIYFTLGVSLPISLIPAAIVLLL